MLLPELLTDPSVTILGLLCAGIVLTTEDCGEFVKQGPYPQGVYILLAGDWHYRKKYVMLGERL